MNPLFQKPNEKLIKALSGFSISAPSKTITTSNAGLVGVPSKTTTTFNTGVNVAPPSTVSSQNLTPTPQLNLPPAPQPTNPAVYQGAIVSAQPTPLSVGNPTQFGAGYTKEFGYNTPPTQTVQTQTSQNNAFDASGNPIQVGNPALNPQFNYGTTATNQNQDIATQINANGVAETKQTGFIDRLGSLYESLIGKTKAQQQAETQYQVPEYQRQLSNINSQITALANEAQAIPLQIQQESEGRGITRAGAAPIETARLRENAIKSLTLNSAASAIQGNLALAQQQADRAVELQFADKEGEIAYLEKVYTLNKDQLEREDKKKADALAIQIEERKRLLDEEKLNRAEVLKIQNAAALSGAPADVLNRISQITDPLQAAQFASPYLAQEGQLQRELLQEQINTQKANQTKVYADIAEANLKARGVQSPYQAERATRNLNQVAELERKAGLFTTGVGALLGFLPATDARNFKGEVETLKGNIFANELTAMREASKTGGAVGNVSDKEGDKLQNALGNLDVFQSPNDFKANLVQVKNSINRWQATIAGRAYYETDDGVLYIQGEDGLYYEV